jgi:hypothetical protein
MRGVIEEESFGTVLDKGTLDAMLCGADAFDSAARLLLEVSRCAAGRRPAPAPPARAPAPPRAAAREARPRRREKAPEAVGGARSVLIPGGLFVLITYGGPDFRLPYLEAPACGWDVLVYVLTRHEGGRGRSPAGSPRSCGGWQARRPRRRRAWRHGRAAALRPPLLWWSGYQGWPPWASCIPCIAVWLSEQCGAVRGGAVRGGLGAAWLCKPACPSPASCNRAS